MCEKERERERKRREEERERKREKRKEMGNNGIKTMEGLKDWITSFFCLSPALNVSFHVDSPCLKKTTVFLSTPSPLSNRALCSAGSG